MRKTPKNLLDGQAGVYAVASQLCLRGFNPHFPAVDVGADLVIDGGIRIQVKSTNLRKVGCYVDGVYMFSLRRIAIEKRKQVARKTIYSDFCDFVVLWGIDHNKFWIVPAPMLDNVQCLAINTCHWYRELNMNDIHRMSDSGMSTREIGKLMNVSGSTIARRLNDVHTEGLRNLAQRVDKLESAWNQIHEYLALISPPIIVKENSENAMKTNVINQVTS